MSLSKEHFVSLIPVTVVETLVVRFSHLTTERPTAIFLYALSINLCLMLIWDIFIWPFFFNPLRYLPTVHVLTPLSFYFLRIRVSN
jgi:hypothetical protein